MRGEPRPVLSRIPAPEWASILTTPVLLVGLALWCASSFAQSQTVTISAERFSRGDVKEGKDGSGSFIIVNSVVEYDLDTSGIQQAHRTERRQARVP